MKVASAATPSLEEGLFPETFGELPFDEDLFEDGRKREQLSMFRCKRSSSEKKMRKQCIRQSQRITKQKLGLPEANV